LGFGSWAAGRFLRTGKLASGIPPLRFYALIELLIGISAILVPYELAWGRLVLEKLDAGSALSPAAFYVAAGVAIGVTLVRWCVCPFVQQFTQRDAGHSEPFSAAPASIARQSEMVALSALRHWIDQHGRGGGLDQALYPRIRHSRLCLRLHSRLVPGGNLSW